MANEEQYKEYHTLHHNFRETYTNVYKHLTDFYPLPKKFIEHTGPEIEKYEEKFSGKIEVMAASHSFEKLFFFSNNFGDFTIKANKLFSEFKAVDDESSAFLKKISVLNGVDEHAVACVELIPELSRLVDRLKKIEEKTVDAEKNLRKLESDWRKVKEKIK